MHYLQFGLLRRKKKSKRKQFIAWMAEVWCIWTSRNKIIYDRVRANFLGSKGYLGAGLLPIMQEDYLLFCGLV
jgi:hypothetical protein